MNSQLVVALDVNDIKKAKKVLNILSDYVKIFKIGPILYTRYGPKIIEVIQEFGCSVFLDLKLHDIPNTVADAVRQMTKLRVFMLTLHISGGAEMMKQAKNAAEDEAKKRNINKPIILGITVLSSLDNEDLKSISIKNNINTQVINLSEMAKENGLDGVVLSAKEARDVREELGKDFIIACPGIRPEGKSKDDQKRVVTPREAVNYGCDYLIIGRPIIESEEPLKMTNNIIKQISLLKG